MNTGESRSFWQRTWRVGVWVALGCAVLELLVVVAFRLRLQPVLDTIRTFNRRFLNPAMLTIAGRRHWYASVIYHIGRTSGKAYATPVDAVPTTQGFIIPLPYGEHVDWLRNVLAAGWASLTVKGTTYTVNQPAVVERAAAEPWLSPEQRRMFRLFGVHSFVQLHLFTRPVEIDLVKTHASGTR